nr:hypothetical protein Iba_chr03bCG3840 [Ipomoea batatas]
MQLSITAGVEGHLVMVLWCGSHGHLLPPEGSVGKCHLFFGTQDANGGCGKAGHLVAKKAMEGEGIWFLEAKKAMEGETYSRMQQQSIPKEHVQNHSISSVNRATVNLDRPFSLTLELPNRKASLDVRRSFSYLAVRYKISLASKDQPTNGYCVVGETSVEEAPMEIYAKALDEIFSIEMCQSARSPHSKSHSIKVENIQGSLLLVEDDHGPLRDIIQRVCERSEDSQGLMSKPTASPIDIRLGVCPTWSWFYSDPALQCQRSPNTPKTRYPHCSTAAQWRRVECTGEQRDEEDAAGRQALRNTAEETRRRTGAAPEDTNGVDYYADLRDDVCYRPLNGIRVLMHL